MAEFNYPNGDLLVSAAWLAQHLHDPNMKIIDARSAQDYTAGHIPGAVLLPNGKEQRRYSGPAANPTGLPNPMPWANPANIAFDDHERSLLVTNHASLVPFDPSLFVVFNVFVDDKGQPLP